MMATKLSSAFDESDGTQWVFASGLVLGLAANLIIFSLAPEPPPSNAGGLMTVGGCFGVASACFSVVGWMLQRFEYIARSSASPTTVPAEIKRRLVDAALLRLFTLSLVGLCLSVAGIAILGIQ